MMTRPTSSAVNDPNTLLVLLMEVYNDLAALLRTQLPSTIPALKAITLPSYAELRKQVGDLAGQLGPRAIIVTAKDAYKNGPLDGGEGIFVWDPTSTLTDNDATVLQPLGLPSGRWRKGSF